MPEKFFKISIWSIILSAIFLLITVAIITLMFNSSLVKGQLFPIYMAVRYIEFGTFFQRLDAVFLLIRIVSFISFLGITSNLCLNIFKEITNINDIRPITYPLMLLIFGLTMLIENAFELELFQNTIFKILFFSVVIVLGLIILILANFKKNFQKKKNNRPIFNTLSSILRKDFYE
jgi:hypothetical protein